MAEKSKQADLPGEQKQNPWDIPMENQDAKQADTAAPQTPDQPETTEETAAAEASSPASEETPPTPDPLAEAKEALDKEHESYLRLAAEYDNFRKRTQKEKDSLYRDAKADTAEKFLSVYDNLSRALSQETADEAYRKGVEMTMTGLKEILAKLEITPFGAPGDAFDPTLHNAVMHVESDSYKDGEIVEVFQEGFKLGDKVIRFAMVQVAN